jgi:C4-dicarboxylate-specific signal transduction histidine kinase
LDRYHKSLDASACYFIDKNGLELTSSNRNAKDSFEDIETKLNQYIWFLMDPNGIIFLSSPPEARLKSLWPLDNEQQQKIRLSKQYGPGPFEPVLRKQLKAGAEGTARSG